MSQVSIGIGIFSILVLLYLIFNPPACQKVSGSLQKLGTKWVLFPKTGLDAIRKVWNRTNLIQAWQTNRETIEQQLFMNVRQRRYQSITLERRQRERFEGRGRFHFGKAQQGIVSTPQQLVTTPPTPIDFGKIDAEAKAEAHTAVERLLKSDPDPATVNSAWARRFLYTFMLVVMITTDVSIVVLRLEALGFFVIPNRLRPILDKAFLLTPLAFISSILLAKMALDEAGNELSAFEKLSPFDKSTKLNIKRLLPYAVLALGLINSVVLIYAASTVGTGGTGFPQYQFVLFVGLTLLTLLATWLGGTALFQSLGLIFAVFKYFISTVFAIVAGVCLLMVSAFLGLFANIGNSGPIGVLKHIVPQPDPIIWRELRTIAQLDGTILLGFGARGTQIVDKIAGALRDLNKSAPKPPLLYVDIYLPNEQHQKQAQDRLRGLASEPPRILASMGNPVQEISEALANVHSLESEGPATIICVVDDGTVEMGLRALHQHEQDIIESHTLQQNPVQNPSRIILIWERSARGKAVIAGQQPLSLTQVSNDLTAWASDPTSLLAGTIVISDESSLMIEAPDRDILIARAIASFIIASRYRGDTSTNVLTMDDIAQQLKASRCPFAALAVGTIGVSSLVINIDGQPRAVMDESLLSLRLSTLMGQFFQGHLTSFRQPPSSASLAMFATVVSQQRSALLDKIRVWATGPRFGVANNNVALIQADLKKKVDLSVAGNFPELGGQAHPQLSLIYTLEQGTVIV